MIKIQERFEVARPLEIVWPLLSDPADVVTCVPGAQLLADKGNGAYDGACSVKFGPVKATFKGAATIAYDHGAHTCAIEARGQDQKGASRGTATATVSAVDEGGRTVVSIDGGFVLNGPLGQFARTGGQHLAREIIAEFARNVAARLSEPAPVSVGSAGATPAEPGGALEPGPAAAGPPQAALAPRPAAPQSQLSAFTLLWRMLKGMLFRR